MNTLSEIFFSGSHWTYVWWAYAITFIIVAASIIIPTVRRKKTLAQIKRKIEKG
mgnify:CR=1 FL=1